MTLAELKARLDQVAHCAAHYVRTPTCGDCLVAETTFQQLWPHIEERITALTPGSPAVTAWLRANGWGVMADAVDAGERLKADGTTLAAYESDESLQCGSAQDRGLSLECTARRGHTLPLHVAHDPEGRVVGTWPTVMVPAAIGSRLWDLVRFMRGELLDAKLITREEYSYLLTEETKDAPGQGSPSPRRLEEYDRIRARLTAAEAALAETRNR